MPKAARSAGRCSPRLSLSSGCSRQTLLVPCKGPAGPRRGACLSSAGAKEGGRPAGLSVSRLYAARWCRVVHLPAPDSSKTQPWACPSQLSAERAPSTWQVLHV